MSDTIFYSLKLKRNKKPEQVFEKIQKAVKPKGPTARWSVSTKEQSLCIDFGDKASETFCLAFDNKEASGSCKVAFPMGGELFDNKNIKALYLYGKASYLLKKYEEAICIFKKISKDSLYKNKYI